MGLTRAGRAVLLGSVVAYAGAWGFGYQELAVVATAGFVLLLFAFVWTFARPRVEVDRAVVPTRVVRGDTAEAQVTVTNPTRWPMWSLRAQDQVGAHTVEATLPRVAAGQSRRGSYALPTRRRGIIDVGPLQVFREDPLGLMRRARQVGDTETLWVYPKIYPLAPLPAGRRRDLEGPTHDGASGSITFHALREYVVGDDLRLIHWRSTARTGTLMVRHQADPSQPQADVVLDTHRLSYPDDEAFESAVEAAASLVAASTAHKFPVRLHASTAQMTSGAGLGAGSAVAASALLDYLTMVEMSDGALLGAHAARLANSPGGQSLVVITGEASPAELAALEALRDRYAAMAVVRFATGRPATVVSEGGMMALYAPDAAGFAELWSRTT